eukprot:2285515-Amphidinium_carterae.1
MAESNHHKGDMVDHRYIAIGQRWERTNLHWSPPPREPKDQRVRGRPSSGVVLASAYTWEAEDLHGSALHTYHLEGRVILTKVHYAAGRSMWVATIYAPNCKDAATRADNQRFLNDLFTYLVGRSDEDIIIVGDFNVEVAHDLASIHAIQSEAFVDVSYAVAGLDVLPTYECGAAATAIDRIV